MDPDRWSCRYGVRPPDGADEARAEFIRALFHLRRTLQQALMNELRKEAAARDAKVRRRRRTTLIAVCAIPPWVLGSLLVWFFPGWWLVGDTILAAGLTLTGWSITRTVKDIRRERRQRS